MTHVTDLGCHGGENPFGGLGVFVERRGDLDGLSGKGGQVTRQANHLVLQAPPPHRKAF